MKERNTQFLNSVASIDKMLASPRVFGAACIHIILILERIEDLLLKIHGPVTGVDVDENTDAS